MQLHPLLRRPFGPLLISDLLMLLALMVGHVAVPWWIAQHGGAADLARYGVVMSLVSMAAMPLLSPLGDRHAKRNLIAWSLACIAVAACVLAWWVGAHGYQLGVVLAIQAVAVMAMAVVQPTSTSLVAELVPPADLTRALGWQQSAQSIGRLAGPALGGAALATAGTEATLWLHAALLAVAAGFATRLPAAPPAAGAGRPHHWWADMRAGLRANWSIPLERGWTSANFASWIFLFPALTMLVPLKVQSLQLSALWLGFCEASLSLGMLVGALGGSAWMIARHGRFRTRVIGAALQGVALAVAGITAQPLVLVAAFAAAGFSISAVTLVGLTHRTLARPLAFRARMAAGAFMTTQVAASLGPALAGVALTRWPIDVVYTAFGLIGGLAALSLGAVPGFKAFMALSNDEVDGWYGKTYPEAFGDAAVR